MILRHRINRLNIDVLSLANIFFSGKLWILYKTHARKGRGFIFFNYNKN